MNLEIIPAINAETFKEVEKKIRQVEPYVRWVHLDVADGTFTPNTLWHNAAELFVLKTNALVEVHLMVEEPEKVIDAWIGAGAKRIIIQVETIEDFTFLKSRCDQHKVFLMVSAAPQTSWQELKPYAAKNVVSYQFLTVCPGLPGQSFIEGGTSEYPENIFDKIKGLRAKCSYCDIEVDGGVRPGIARRCREAGANLFAAASAIFSGLEIKTAIDALKNDVAL
ncbi:MAG: hypothetical protein HY220_00750 [Candidatus Sungbacteria bacterium]|uniref:Ribulose-phosphate 3-epimerase n=1 Tax=Candidatus Sungiibacteriota bacterium TaxID=2750080 RepID=A0A9D6LRA9_9BACT|nr:hypothetical protein [Candidatus Sungbacteria bacterium]